MITRDTLRYGLYIGAAVLLLTLTGIFSTFAQREVVDDAVTLDYVFLVIVLAGAGFFAATKAHVGLPVRTVLNGIAGATVIGALLAALVLLQTEVDLSFIFPDLKRLLGGTLTLGQDDLWPGIANLLVASAVLGAAGGALPLLHARVRRVLLMSLSLTVITGLLQAQLENVITLADAIALLVAFAAGYAVTQVWRQESALARGGVGLVAGGVFGAALSLLVSSGVLGPNIIPRPQNMFTILAQTGTTLVPFVAAFGLVGAVGGLVAGASAALHNGAVFFFVALVILGMLNWQGAMTISATVLTFLLLAVPMWLVPPAGKRADASFEALSRPERQRIRSFVFVASVLILIVAPLFLGQYITNVLNLVGLYIVMGIGLNVVVGYAGLLDLGYVAFFAIGAYSVGLLTTPSLLTCGGVGAREITPENIEAMCTGVMTFWEAWPVAILIAAFSGVLLGIPVLRLRGDYLAIVTLGFGEIIRIIVKFDDFKPLFGAAQGIANIPRPYIDFTAFNPAWHLELSGAMGIYYLVLFSILVTALIALRLANTRLGRAWRAMRADEDVAQAMGISLVRTKLLAFAIGAAFAGMGGAIFGSNLYGAYPDSFTLLVSINVLSLVIIGGLGSIPGVVVGALMLIGLPEVLRELESYRLLAFGSLLVITMLLKPDGLIPPPVRRLSEIAEDHHARQGAR